MHQTIHGSRYSVVHNIRDGMREGRNGRLYETTVNTWDVVDNASCGLVAECYTKREALERMARLEAK
jgi:hypothetical protein